MDDHSPNDVPRHKEFESQQDCSSQILATDTICIQCIGLAVQEKTGRCDDCSDDYDRYPGSINRNPNKLHNLAKSFHSGLKSLFLRRERVTIKPTLLFEGSDLVALLIAGASSVQTPSARARRFCWSVGEPWNQFTGMEPENLDIEQINEERRKAIQKNIEVISVDDLKALGEKLFPYADHPWREKFFEFIEQHSSDTCYHATTNDGIEVLYCPATEKGMWYTKASGMGPLSAKAIVAMKEIVAR